MAQARVSHRVKLLDQMISFIFILLLISMNLLFQSFQL